MAERFDAGLRRDARRGALAAARLFVAMQDFPNTVRFALVQTPGSGRRVGHLRVAPIVDAVPDGVHVLGVYTRDVPLSQLVEDLADLDDERRPVSRPVKTPGRPHSLGWTRGTPLRITGGPNVGRVGTYVAVQGGQSVLVRFPDGDVRCVLRHLVVKAPPAEQAA